MEKKPEETFGLKSQGEFSRNFPKFFLNEIGDKSCLVSPFSGKCSPLYLLDLQNILLYTLLGDVAPYKPRWCDILRRGKVQHAVLVIIEGIGISEIKLEAEKKEEMDYDLPQVENGFKSNRSQDPPLWLTKCLPQSAHLFNVHSEIYPPSQNTTEIINEAFFMPASANILVKMEEDRLNKDILDGIVTKDCSLGSKFENFIPTEDAFDRRQLLLSLEDLYKYEYPLQLPGAVGYSDQEFKNSLPFYKPVTSSSPMFGLDCEMVITDAGQELAAIAIVNEQHELLYSTLVKPYAHVLDYVSRFSGISKDILKDVKTRLPDVQKKIAEILPPDAIIVGHSLLFDLKALKLFHPYVIDTSLIYNMSGIRVSRPGLRFLTKILFNKDIQSCGSSGHDPSEDASASLKLAQLKLTNNVDFGDFILNPHTRFECSPKIIYEIQRNIQRYNENLREQIDVTDFDISPSEQKQHLLNVLKFISSRCHISLHLSPRVLNKNGEIYQNCTSSIEIHKKTSDIFKSVIQNYQNTIKKELSIVHIKIKHLEKLPKELSAIDDGLRLIYDHLPEKSLFLTLFCKPRSSSDTEPNSNGSLHITMKGQDKNYRYIKR